MDEKTVYQLSASIELMFTDVGPSYGDRIRAAADAGIDIVEIWFAGNKDLDELEKALDECGSRIWTMLAEPRFNFMLEKDHAPFYDGLRRSIEIAKRLSCSRLVVSSGVGFPALKRAEQLRRMREILSRMAEIAEPAGMQILLENVNTRVDHPGILLDLAAECGEVARAVGSPSVGLLFDLYHAFVQAEDVEEELRRSADLISHVQIADAPGRGEPGSGTVDWAHVLRVLRGIGYDGPLGLEYVPTGPTAQSLETIKKLAASI